MITMQKQWYDAAAKNLTHTGSFDHSFHKHFLYTCRVPGTVLRAGSPAVIDPCLPKVSNQPEEESNMPARTQQMAVSDGRKTKQVTEGGEGWGGGVGEDPPWRMRKNQCGTFWEMNSRQTLPFTRGTLGNFLTSWGLGTLSTHLWHAGNKRPLLGLKTFILKKTQHPGWGWTIRP